MIEEVVAVGIPPDKVIVSTALVTETAKLELNAIGAEISWLPFWSLTCAFPVAESVRVLDPAIVYLNALLKASVPAVSGVLIVTVRGAVISEKKSATAFVALGATPVDQLGPSFQVWTLSSRIHRAGG